MERARALYSAVDLTILLANKKHSSNGDDLMNKDDKSILIMSDKTWEPGML